MLETHKRTVSSIASMATNNPKQKLLSVHNNVHLSMEWMWRYTHIHLNYVLVHVTKWTHQMHAAGNNHIVNKLYSTNKFHSSGWRTLNLLHPCTHQWRLKSNVTKPVIQYTHRRLILERFRLASVCLHFFLEPEGSAKKSKRFHLQDNQCGRRVNRILPSPNPFDFLINANWSDNHLHCMNVQVLV